MCTKIIDESKHLDQSYLDILKGKRALCLVDGQHYPPVTKWTVKELEKEGADIYGLLFLGGTEKVKNAVEELGEEGKYKIFIEETGGELPLDLLDKVLKENDLDIVIDLSDEPVIDYTARFKLASIVLENSCTYFGSDFIFTPPRTHDILRKPSISIIGTGKRVGKTAVSVSIARMLKRKGYEPVIVCMGRGGPPDPDYVNTEELEMNAETLLGVAEKGGHAASDYWEDALLAEVPTIGCRRCGGGMAGNPFSSNVIKGAYLANEIPQEFVIMEGSGPTFPPVRTDASIVIIGSGQPIRNIMEFFGQYRLMVSDLAIVTMCEEPMADEDKLKVIEEGIMDINPDIKLAMTVFRPEPLGDIKNKKVFLATTANEKVVPILKGHLEKNHNCEIVEVSNNLSNRPKLKKDLERGLKNADLLLTEIKAASIDLAGRMANKMGLEIVFMHNEMKLVGGNIDDLEECINDICHDVVERGEIR